MNVFRNHVSDTFKTNLKLCYLTRVHYAQHQNKEVILIAPCSASIPDDYKVGPLKGYAVNQ